MLSSVTEKFKAQELQYYKRQKPKTIYF